MAKNESKNLNKSAIEFKLISFYTIILIITIIFSVLFVIKFNETRSFSNYRDIEKSKLVLSYNSLGREGEYAVYVVSAKKNDDNFYIDTSNCDQLKAIDLLPSMLNYFNYVKRNQRTNRNLVPIYLYNVSGNSKDIIFTELSEKGFSYKIKDLPCLIIVNNTNQGVGVDQIIIQTNEIQNKLDNFMGIKK